MIIIPREKYYHKHFSSSIFLDNEYALCVFMKKKMKTSYLLISCIVILMKDWRYDQSHLHADNERSASIIRKYHSKCKETDRSTNSFYVAIRSTLNLKAIYNNSLKIHTFFFRFFQIWNIYIAFVKIHTLFQIWIFSYSY